MLIMNAIAVLAGFSRSSNMQDNSSKRIRRIQEDYTYALRNINAVSDDGMHDLAEQEANGTTIAVMAAACTLLGAPTDWDSALAILTDASTSFRTRVEAFSVAGVRATRAAHVARLVQTPDLEPVRSKAVSSALYAVNQWVHAANAVCTIDDAVASERRQLALMLESSNMAQVTNLQAKSAVHVAHPTSIWASICIKFFAFEYNQPVLVVRAGSLRPKSRQSPHS
jgi:hypothetical protein